MGTHPKADDNHKRLHYSLLTGPAKELYISCEVLAHDLVIQAEGTLGLTQGLCSPHEWQGLLGSCKDQKELCES